MRLQTTCLVFSTAHSLLMPGVISSTRSLRLFSTVGDGVTGTKFEEEDATKNPERRPGHQVKGMAEMDEETAARMAAIRAHQEACPRLSWAEEIRTIAGQKEGFGVLSTVGQKDDVKGFPIGSIVGFAVDDDGLPVFSFSGMSAHTKNLDKDARASLTITEPAFEGAADARVVLTGRVTKTTDEAAREAYRASHPGAYWVDFGDFHMYRMDEILDVAFVGGFARAGGVTPAEYSEAQVDPLADFFKPIATHMNEDHESSLKNYVEILVGAAEVKSAEMKRLDRFGFDVRVVDKKTGSKGVLRVPFEEPVTERKAVKDAIVALSKKAAAMAGEKDE